MLKRAAAILIALLFVFSARAAEMSIEDQLQDILDSKEMIRQSINSKGVTVSKSIPFSQYASRIGGITQSFSGSDVPPGAGSVILMIGDGMGINHVNCVGGFLSTQPVSAWVETSSNNNSVTESAAAATAFACGIKTNNNYVGMYPSGTPCETIAEKSHAAGYGVIVASSDNYDGATNAAFYAHVIDRNNSAGIALWMTQTSMTIRHSIPWPSAFVSSVISSYDLLGKDGRIGGKPFFWMIEEAHIDKISHNGDFSGMSARMNDFNIATQAAVNFVANNPDVTLVIVGDHETGGLSPYPSCGFTAPGFGHTGANVPLYAYGKYDYLFGGIMTNAEVGVTIRNIIFPQ
jgi:alkaline phosphatase